MRSALFPARLALARLRAAPARSALVALGIAVGAAMLALSVGGSTAVRDRAVAVELARLGPSDASLQVVWSGVLFEIATIGPGFTTDEPKEHLGERLSLPPAFEHLRDQVEPILTPLPSPRLAAGVR